jgi:L-threonylcarbamoyladenylate synthase
MAESGQDLQKAIALLRNSELVAIPTETVYGLAGNALDEVAITKIFEAKNRPFFDPLIMHTDRLDKVRHLIEGIPEKLLDLSLKYMPGPLTILVKKSGLVPDLITAGSEKVAIRIPDHPLTLELLKELDFPLAAPSANPFGYISPTTAAHVQKQLGNKIQYILDGGPCGVGLESTIVEWKDEKLFVLRKGGIPIEELGENVVVADFSSSNPSAPGMLKSHYAPKVPVLIDPDLDEIEKYNLERIGVLAFDKALDYIPVENQLLLSKNGDIKEAARQFFSHLRTLDEMDIDLIIASFVPDKGLGKAINDKLRRASSCE